MLMQPKQQQEENTTRASAPPGWFCYCAPVGANCTCPKQQLESRFLNGTLHGVAKDRYKERDEARITNEIGRRRRNALITANMNVCTPITFVQALVVSEP
jgi:hypothetical protein